MHPALAALALLTALCACGGEGDSPAPPVAASVAAEPVVAQVLVADSPQTLLAWTQALPAAREGHQGLLEGVVYGQKVFVRAVVTGYAPAAQAEEPVTGSLRLKGPDGGVLHHQDVRATAADLDDGAPGVLVLKPGLDVLFDPGDAVGTYVIEAELEHGGHLMTHSQPLRVEAGGEFLAPPAGEAL